MSEWSIRRFVRSELARMSMEMRKYLAIKYPHMGPYEAYIWDQFLMKTDLRFEKIEYDVRVGKPNVPDWLINRLRNLEERLRMGDESVREEYEITLATYKSISALTKLRIDAVGHTHDLIWIFEVKPRANLLALGQLITYVNLYRIEFNPRKPIMGACVCIAVDPNAKIMFDRYGFRIFNVREL